ncbi:XdhC family protein [Limnoglobus roseus]|uniref:Putative xanthine dehydrogenase subunit A n=1 Tax=Limnoglobus roseus TaxID=2598579 RepID=A0A5C1AML0_9BACT|nr:XdhC/CoxI family protein [Limnoglobus roseus]QEL20659.1 putative xanthine dehydrogenase subunit A [Limnoglobus roseus]
MDELRHILTTSTRLRNRGEQAVLATVVKTEGSTYRRPGARLLIGRGGDAVGGVSGGCLEGDLVRKAWWRTEGGPAVVTYDSRADDETAWQFGLGCNGVVHVLLERLSPSDTGGLAFVEQCVRARLCGVIATVFRAGTATGLALGDRLTLDARGKWGGHIGDPDVAPALGADAEACLRHDRGRTVVYGTATGEIEVAFEVVRPTVRLLVFGGGFDAVPVVAAAKAVGWEVVVIDRRAGARRIAGADRTLTLAPAAACERLRPASRTAAVVMNHNFPDDRDAVTALLRTGVQYVGVLGPKARTQTMLAEIPDAVGLSRLHAPVGLDIGADTPGEIAAAVVAQVIAVFADRDGGHLRDRTGPIHRRDPAAFAGAAS